MRHDAFPAGALHITARPYCTITVIGAGGWGTALACTAAATGAAVRLWGRDADQMTAMSAHGRNPAYLRDIDLPDNLRPTADLADAVAGSEAVLIVVPSRAIREVCDELAQCLPDGVPVAMCAKGIEAQSGLLMSDIAEEVLPGRPIGAISGPTFARETALGHPTAATVAFPFSRAERLDPGNSVAARMAVTLTTQTFRPYVSDDVTGIEVCGAVKNVIALACGMMSGAGFAENTKAALITRGLNEMMALSAALGGRPETVTGLAGIGDLSLTCASPTSRNMSLGQQLGSGTPRDQCFDGKPIVVEGEANARSVTDLARRLQVAMPICEAVRAIIHDGADLGGTFAALWSSPIEAEPSAMDVAFQHPASSQDVQKLAERIL